MEIHNKFELVRNGKTIVCKNRMFTGTMYSITKFGGYADCIGFYSNQTVPTGGRRVEVLGLYKTEVVNWQTDPFKGILYCRRRAVIPADALVGQTIYACGFYGTNKGDMEVQPDGSVTNIHNYYGAGNFALLVDDDGNPAPITKDDKPLEVFATTYLDWRPSAVAAVPTKAGEFLIKQLLGSYQPELIEYPMVAGIGGDTTPNDQMIEYDYEPNNSIGGTASTATPLATGLLSFYYFRLTHSPTFAPEYVVSHNNKVIMRFPRTPAVGTTTQTDSGTASVFGELTLTRPYPMEITSIKNTTTGEEIAAENFANYPLVAVPSNVTPMVLSPFGVKKYDPNKTFVSKCGNMIGFVLDRSFDLYKIQNARPKKLNTLCVSRAQSIKAVEMFDDNVFIVYNSSPFVEAYKIEDDTLKKCSINVEGNASTVLEPAFECGQNQYISVGLDSAQKYNIFVKLDQNTAYILQFSYQNRAFLFESKTKVPLKNLGVCGALVAGGNKEGYVVVSGQDQTDDTWAYRFNPISKEFEFLSSTFAAVDLAENVTSFVVGKNHIHVTKPTHEAVWFFDDLRRIKLSANSNLVNKISGAFRCCAKEDQTTHEVTPYFLDDNGVLNQSFSKPDSTRYQNDFLGVYVLNDIILFLLSGENGQPTSCYCRYRTDGMKKITGLTASNAYEITYKNSDIAEEMDVETRKFQVRMTIQSTRDW